MRAVILSLSCLCLPLGACDDESTPTDLRSGSDLDRLVDQLEDEQGLVSPLDLVDALQPTEGSCKFESDSKSCGMACDTFSVSCAMRNDVANCTICTPAGCSGFMTDGCDPDTWP